MSKQLCLRDERLTWKAVEGQLVALDVEASVYLAANHTGAILWTALASGTTRDALIALLVEKFNVPSQLVAEDVDRFLGELSSRGLLKS